jgi:hypothetical protein
MELAVRYYRKAVSQSDCDGMHNFARCLEYGKGIGQDFIRAAKYYRRSAELNNAAAENSFGICLERGIGVQSNIALAAYYYQRSALQGHPDGANNLGFCLEHGRGVEQDITQAAKYYKYAADQGHPEGELNYHRCLRLLGRWDLLDRSSPPTCSPPSDDCLAGLFLDCLKDLEAEHRESTTDDSHPGGKSNYRRCLRLLGAVGVPFPLSHLSVNSPTTDDLAWLKKSEVLDGGFANLLASIDRLRVSIAGQTHFHAAAAEWSTKSELGDGDSSNVTLSRCPDGALVAVKTPATAEGLRLIEREAAIHEKLKHPLVLEFRERRFEMASYNSLIVTNVA